MLSSSISNEHKKKGRSQLNCGLLGKESKLAKLFEEHKTEEIALQFERNKILKSSFSQKLSTVFKISGATLVGASVGRIAGTTSMSGGTSGAVVTTPT